jgi:hypothetical protein
VVETAEYDQLWVEDIDQVADAEPQPTSHFCDGGEGRLVTCLGPGQHGLQDSDATDRRRDPGVTGKRLFSGLCLPATPGSAPAVMAIRVDQGVPCLTCVTGGAEHRLAIVDHPGSDAGFTGQIDEIRHPGAHPSTVLGEGS